MALWTSSTYLNHHLVNFGDVGMAKRFKVFHVDICNDRGDQVKPWLHPVIVYRFFVEAEDAVGDSEFQKPDEFFCMDLADIGEIGAEILELITCSATGTGLLVKRVLTSNETKFLLLDLLREV